MKQKLVLLFSLVLMASGLFAQMDAGTSTSTKKGKLFGIHFNAVDFKTPVTWRNNTSSRDFAEIKDMDFGFSLSFWKGLNSRIDFSTKFTTLVHNYGSEDRNESTTKTEIGLELEPTLNVRALKDNSLINPFLSVGIGGGYYTGEFAAYVPTGVGLQLNFNSVTYLMIQASYRWTLSKDDLKDNLLYSFGIAQNFGAEKPKVVPPPPPPVVLDRDNDGVLDADDKCPDTPGSCSFTRLP